MTTDTITQETIFASAHAALTFAFNYAPEQYAPSVMAKLVQSTTRPPPSRFADARGGSLVGMHGAGQAGMILGEVRLLGVRELDVPGFGLMENDRFVAESAPHFMAARFAPTTIPCACRKACCAGQRPSPDWWAATAAIAALAMQQEAAAKANYRLRHGLVKRFFGSRVNMTELAKHAQVSRDTASQVNADLLPWLRHEEGRAYHAITAALKERRFIE